MPGIDIKRFIALDKGLAQELKCGICLNIFNKAVDTTCEHTFCKSCITAVIDTNLFGSFIGQNTRSIRCPECRQMFTVSKVNNEWQLKNNRRINGIIDRQRIRCDFAAKGCAEEFEYGLQSAHLNACAFNMCSKCGLSFGGNREQHDCFSLLKYENKELNDKCSNLSTKCSHLLTKNKDLSAKSSHLLTKNKDLSAKCNDLLTKNKDLSAKCKRMSKEMMTLKDKLNVETAADNRFRSATKWEPFRDNRNGSREDTNSMNFRNNGNQSGSQMSSQSGSQSGHTFGDRRNTRWETTRFLNRAQQMNRFRDLKQRL